MSFRLLSNLCKSKSFKNTLEEEFIFCWGSRIWMKSDEICNYSLSYVGKKKGKAKGTWQWHRRGESRWNGESWNTFALEQVCFARAGPSCLVKHAGPAPVSVWIKKSLNSSIPLGLCLFIARQGFIQGRCAMKFIFQTCFLSAEFARSHKCW